MQHHQGQHIFTVLLSDRDQHARLTEASCIPSQLHGPDRALPAPQQHGRVGRLALLLMLINASKAARRGPACIRVAMHVCALCLSLRAVRTCVAGCNSRGAGCSEACPLAAQGRVPSRDGAAVEDVPVPDGGRLRPATAGALCWVYGIASWACITQQQLCTMRR